jgi:pilus assembly protein CpaE
MTMNSKTTRVVAIIDPGFTQQQISAAIGSQQEFELVDTFNSQEKLMREVRAAEPDILLVDHVLNGAPTLDFIDELALQFPEASIIAILPGEDSQKAQQVMLAGARAFLIHPFTQINLLSTLRRVRDLETRRIQTQAVKQATIQEAQHPLRTLAVFSPRGGAGCTTIAINLALALQEETNQRILLMEGKLFFGHLGVMLNLRAQNSVADLIPHANHLDEGLVHDVVSEHVSGIDVLMAPSDFQVSQGIRSDDLYNIFTTLQRMYDFIVVDAGSALNENSVTLMDAADKILLIANPDLASLHDISRFYGISQSLAYPAEKLLIVLNRAGLPGGIRNHDIENALHFPVFAQIPNDDANAIRSLNRGVPLLFKYPRSPASRAFKQLGKSLIALQPTEAPVPTGLPQKAQREALLASSRLG